MAFQYLTLGGRHQSSTTMKTTITLLSLFLPLVFWAQPTIDGDLSDADYVSVATKANANMGFGPNTDVTEIVYYSDPGARILYVGVKSVLDNGTNNGIGLMMNLTGAGGLPGAPACSPLGWEFDVFGNPVGHYMSGNFGFNSFFADFEVDLLFAYNPGTSSTNCFLDMTSVVAGLPVAYYLGDCGQSGVPAINTDPTTGITFTFAFQNGGGNQGMEVAVDYSSTTLNPDDMEAFAFVVSNTAFFSDVVVPGNITTGNPGFSPDFCTLPGGLFHSTLVPVPVELIFFEASKEREEVVLHWATATETNSAYFEVQRSQDLQDWATIGTIEAAGNSFSQQNYSLRDGDPQVGENYYRLKQVDLDGSVSYSEVISLVFDAEEGGIMFPNPVEDELIISVGSPGFLQIYDTAGRLVHSQPLTVGSNTFRLGDWHAGLYYVQAVTELGSSLLQEVLVVK
jgi:hypothetical protein